MAVGNECKDTKEEAFSMQAGGRQTVELRQSCFASAFRGLALGKLSPEDKASHRGCSTHSQVQ